MSREMKIVILSLLVMILSVTFLMTHQYVYANTCAVKGTSFTMPQFYLYSDKVFVGTISSINNYTNHQWIVQFDVEKIWKGGQNSTITLITTNLQACGYSLIEGDKYLVFASGSPSDYNPWATKTFADAQNDIALLNSSKFQVDAQLKEELYKKLITAQNVLSSMMTNKSSKIPISMAYVDEVNLTLIVGIDDTKTSSSSEEYQKRVKDIVGDIPIKIEFGHAVAPVFNLPPSTPSPLQQFKSGISAKDVTCNIGFQNVVKAEDGSPACVKPITVSKLVERGWAKALQ